MSALIMNFFNATKRILTEWKIREVKIITARNRKTGLLLLLICFLITVMITGLDNRLTITEYQIHSDLIINPQKIVLLTDLHSCYYGLSQDELIEAVHEQNPDLVLMSGDMADDGMPDEGVIDLLEGIAGRYPCYYVSGNHEYWSGRVKAQKEMFRSYGVKVLEGETDSITLNGQVIFISGIDDPYCGAEMFEAQLRAVGEAAAEDRYTILLSHRPEWFDQYAEYNFNLVVSGHAHGGQWRVPYLLTNGLFAPDQGLFPRLTTGVHDENHTTMVVSRGLSRESTRIPRFFNPPELVIIELMPGRDGDSLNSVMPAAR